MARARWPWNASRHQPEPLPRDPDEIAELLQKVRQLRMTLTADLSAAAGALDDERPEVARDIIAADQVEVRQLGAQLIPPRRTDSPRRRRVLLALPAIPLVGALAVTGAAALSSHPADHGQHQADRSIVTAIDTPATIRQTAATTLHQLERVVTRHHHQRQVVSVAAHLHNQLTALITTAPHHPKQLGEVQRLLSLEQQLLESHRGEGTAIALAASRHLNELLAAAGVPTTVPSTLPTILVPPTKRATTSPIPTATASSPKPHPSTSPTHATTSSPRPTPTSTSTRHHHRRHHHLTNPLLGTGLLNNKL